MSTVDDPQEPTTPLLEPEEDYDDIDKVPPSFHPFDLQA